MHPTAAVLPIAFPLLVLAHGCQHGAMLPSRPVTTAGAGSSLGIRRTIIGRAPAHEAGWETRLYLIEYPPGTAAPPHVHPVVGVGWVIGGEFESAFGDDAVMTVKAGQSFTDLAGVPHRLFRNPSTEHPLRFVIAYTIPTGEENFHPLQAHVPVNPNPRARTSASRQYSCVIGVRSYAPIAALRSQAPAGWDFLDLSGGVEPIRDHYQGWPG